MSSFFFILTSSYFVSLRHPVDVDAEAIDYGHIFPIEIVHLPFTEACFPLSDI